MSKDAAAEIDVWLDVDTSIGLPQGEVDDGLALIQAFHSSELQIRGVSVVFGNTSLEKAVPIAREIVGRFGPPGLAVHSGAASAEDFGQETDAARAMAAALGERRMTILALGPVTNVGTLVKSRPELQERIEAIVMVAARRPGQRFQTGTAREPHRDFNFELDPAAMAAILDTKIPLVFAPWEVSSKVWITREDLDSLAARGGSGAYLAEACRSWLAMWKERFGVDGFNPFDTLAVGWVARPDLIESTPVGVWIEQAPDDRAPPGQEPAMKPYLLVDSSRRDLRQARYCHTPNERFKRLLIQALGSQD
jgi:pyrimidine-specific ribonucleoside hydrolase